MSSSFSNRHGAERNINGGLFIRGQAYKILTKLQVAEEYKAAVTGTGCFTSPAQMSVRTQYLGSSKKDFLSKAAQSNLTLFHWINSRQKTQSGRMNSLRYWGHWIQIASSLATRNISRAKSSGVRKFEGTPSRERRCLLLRLTPTSVTPIQLSGYRQAPVFTELAKRPMMRMPSLRQSKR